MEERKTDVAKVGKLGELIAADFLTNKSYKLLEQNKRYKIGEIDLIMIHPRGGLCFVEVKTKSCDSFEFHNKREELLQGPREQLHENKLRKLYKAIHTYLQHSGQQDLVWQLDAVLVLFNKEENQAYCRHVEYISLER